METWRDIAEYEGLYQVSNLGNIRSYDRYETICNRWGGTTIRLKKGRQKAQTICPGNAYFSVMLNDSEGNEKRIYVHRIVALTFLTKVCGKNFVNHKDGNKLNNNASILEWCTRSENMLHAMRTGLSSNLGGSHYKARQIINSENGKQYASVKDAARDNGLGYSYLKGMLGGHNKNISRLEYLENS